MATGVCGVTNDKIKDFILGQKFKGKILNLAFQLDKEGIPVFNVYKIKDFARELGI